MKLVLLFFLPVALAGNCWPAAPGAGDFGRCYWGTKAYASCVETARCTGKANKCTVTDPDVGLADCT
ncbi:hypothetical protein FMUND_13531 [Fusarium mundagurra]|uniref:Uncharacterized protein n=1 Tax=Fusarium mundagurra TaxID=1567541 RepID=A0A8H6D2U7_9HYPO|nr:hypothetical protein FMUND_13531 [Fusarium mundagurra]